MSSQRSGGPPSTQIRGRSDVDLLSLVVGMVIGGTAVALVLAAMQVGREGDDGD